MPYYDEQKKKNKFIRGLMLGAGAAAALIGRKQIGQAGARLVDSLTDRVIRNKSTSVFGLAEDLLTTNRVIQGEGRRAATSVAAQRMSNELATKQRWSSEAVNDLFNEAGRQQFWAGDRVVSSAELAGAKYANLRALTGKDAPELYQDIIRARNDAKVYSIHAGQKGAANANVPWLAKQVAQTEAGIRSSFLSQKLASSKTSTVGGVLKGEGGYSNLLHRALGLTQLTVQDVLNDTGAIRTKLGDTAFEALTGAEGTIAQLNRMATSDIGPPVNIGSFKLGELYRGENGQIYDTRGVGRVVDRVSNWLDDNTQLPMIPFMEGFSPTSLFSWLRSGEKSFAQTFSRQTLQQQIGIRDLITSPTMGGIRVGSDLLGTEYSAFVAPAEGLKTLATDIAGLNAESGFGRRALNALYASKNMAPTSPNGVLGSVNNFFGLGKQLERSQWDNVLQVGRRLLGDKSVEGELHPTEALKRMIGRRTGEVTGPLTEEGTKTVANFIYRRGSLVTEGLNMSMIKDNDLSAALNAIRSDEAVTAFFEGAQGDYSPRLTQMISDYRASGGELAKEYHPFAEESVLSFNLFGKAKSRRGIDSMRTALQSEYLENRFEDGGMAGLQRLVGEIRGTQTGKVGARRESEAVVRSFMLHKADDQSVSTALDLLLPSGDIEAQAAIKQTLKDYTGNFTVADGMPDIEMPKTFLVRQHKSVLGAINDAIKQRRNPLQAVLNFGQSPAVNQYFGAFFQGVDNPKNFTQTSLTDYFMAERVNRMMSGVGLGLGPEDMQSTFSIWAGLGLKRVMPVLGAYELYNQANNAADDLGVPAPDELLANAGANLHLAKARFTNGKHATQLMPGSEKYFNNTSFEDEKKRIESGYEPMRGNKFWLFGSRSEFFGGKIKYFQPDRYQRAHSSWETASNSAQGGQDYQAHNWLPSLRYPLAPLAKLVDPYWWENKNSVGDFAERPYVRSGPLFSPETPWGPALNNTIGALIKPQRWLHPEYNPFKRSKEQIYAETYGPSNGTTRVNLLPDEGEVDVEDAALESYAEDDPKFTLNRGVVGIIKPAGGISLMSGPSVARATTAGVKSVNRGVGVLSSKEHTSGVLTRLNTGIVEDAEEAHAIRLQDQYTPNVIGYDENPKTVQIISNRRYFARSVQDLHGIYGWGTAELLGQNTLKGVRLADSSNAYGIGERFWDLNLGGLGGEANEVFRRFLPRRPRTVEYYNPVPNSYFGTWLPGDTSFINFQRGDPQGRLEVGPLRLPGEAYERVHGMKFLQTSTSSLTKNVEDLAQEMLSGNTPYIPDYKTELHKYYRDAWRRQGIYKGKGQDLYDERLGMAGHVDAYLRIGNKTYLGDIQEVDDEQFKYGKITSEAANNLNFNMYATGIHSSIAAIVNKDHPDQFRIEQFNYDKKRQNYLEDKITKARDTARSIIGNNDISRAELYDPTTRFEILADISPYSSEYKQLATELAHDTTLTDEQHVRFQAAKKRARAVKQRYNLYAYHFTHGAGDLISKDFTVKSVLDPNTIVTEEGETIKLAGVRASEGRATDYLKAQGIDRLDPESKTGSVEQLYAKLGLTPGSTIQVNYAQNPAFQRSQDMFESLRGDVIVKGKSLNKQLLDIGVGKERETDWSAPAMQVRFTARERALGKAWETIAHMDTPFNTKLMRVRTPLEEYKRTQVYGSNSGDWANPINTLIKPSVLAYVARSPLIAAGSMGLFASMFGKTRSSKLLFGKYGAAIGLAASLGAKAIENATGNVWIPAETQKRRDIEDYYDKLKYVKFNRLYTYAKERALKEEGVDIEAALDTAKKAGEVRKEEVKRLKLQKASSRLAGKQTAVINARLKEISNYSTEVDLGPWAAQALLYRTQYESTFYGHEKGAPYMNLMRAMPKYEREIISGIVKDSTQKEKEEFFKLLPEHEKAALAGQLGVEYTGKKPLLDEYFKSHTLPGLGWKGWDPNTDLNKLKARTAREERIDTFSMGIFPQEVEKAEATTSEISVPTVHGSTVKAKELLAEVLAARGIAAHSVQVEIYPDQNLTRNQVEVEGNISHDREQDLVSAIRKYR
jgi:hypothetical protein